jgi:hypothetical protein
MTCVERKFELQGRKCKWEEYKGTRYSDGDSVLVVELWLHRVPDDLSGLTFQEWDPSSGSDDTSDPLSMFVNSSELRFADFPLTEVRPLQLDAVTRGGRRTRGATVRKLQGVGNSTFVLSVENDNDFTVTSGQDVSEFLDTLGIVKSYFLKFFDIDVSLVGDALRREKKKLKKSRIFFFGLRRPEDEAIILFGGFLANPDMSLIHNLCLLLIGKARAKDKTYI